MKYTNAEIRAMIAREIDATTYNNMFSSSVYTNANGDVFYTIFNELMSVDLTFSFDELEFSIAFLISDCNMNMRCFDVYNDTWNNDANDSIDCIDSSLDLNMRYILQCFNDACVECEKRPNESELYIVDLVKKSVYLADSNTVPGADEVLVDTMDKAIEIMPKLV